MIAEIIHRHHDEIWIHMLNFTEHVTDRFEALWTLFHMPLLHSGHLGGHFVLCNFFLNNVT